MYSFQLATGLLALACKKPAGQEANKHIWRINLDMEIFIKGKKTKTTVKAGPLGSAPTA